MLKTTSHDRIDADSRGLRELPSNQEGLVSPSWSSLDTYLIIALSLIAMLTRFWRLGQPPTLVWDEKWTVWLARSYLQNEPARATHPPLTAFLIATCIKLFGDEAWSWRLPSAILGSALVAITYLLGKRLFNSRLAAAFAAMLIILDGLFLVESRFAVWEIYYVSFAALSYLLLFQFVQNSSPILQRRLLVLTGVSLGLALGSKLLIPAVTELLVVGSIIFAMYWIPCFLVAGDERKSLTIKRVFAVVALVGGISALVYMCIYLPNYWLGWWRGVSDQIASYHEEAHYQGGFINGSHEYGSPWWSWPMMLRPVMFWTKKEFLFTADAQVSSIRAFGNPFIWSGVMVSIPILVSDLMSRFSFSRAFVVLGYLLYLAAWAAIPRYHFIYHYLPSLYLGIVALAVVLSDCWSGVLAVWQQAALLFAIFLPLSVGYGLRDGLIAGSAMGLFYLCLRIFRLDWANRFVVIVFSFAASFGFIYFLPMWIGTSLSQSGFADRLWLQGSNLANWL